MYPAEPMVTVNPGPVGRLLEGASRPGFFDGVLTVVLKLFQLTRPDIAVFGAKDAQQVALVRRMVGDLDLGVQIETAPLHRDRDGLATSSRNVYLSAAERTSGLAISAALAAAAQRASGGPEAALAAARAVLDAAATASPPLRLDYLVLADPVTFAPVGPEYQGHGAVAGGGEGRPDQADRQCHSRLRWCPMIDRTAARARAGLDAGRTDVVVVGSGRGGGHRRAGRSGGGCRTRGSCW